MKVFAHPDELSMEQRSFGLALGVFDGVHLGHQAVINAARGSDLLGVVTFDPHPVQVLAPDHAPRRILANLSHKMRILAALRVDFMIVYSFTREFAARDAEDFARELLSCGPSCLAAGEDWRFGRNREGTIPRLAAWSQKAGVETKSIGAIKLDGERISSTRIRQCLRDGRLDGAAAMLGRPYSVFGQVVQGRQIGRTIGFPTANVSVSEELLPPNGVYLIKGNHWDGVANVGTRPTVDQTPRRTLEVHLFSDKIPMEYGWDLEVGFVRQLRDEKKFDSIDALREQIDRDVKEAKSSLSDDS